MNNKMNEMMNTMMEQMMDKMMENVMASFMNAFANAMTPQVANAETVDTPTVEETKAYPKGSVISREEWLKLVEEPKKSQETDYTGLDIVSFGNKMVKYNMPVNSNIWQYTDMVVRNKYNGRATKYQGQFAWAFDNPADKKKFFQCFQVKTTFTDEEVAMIKQYKKNKEVARAKKLLESVEE